MWLDSAVHVWLSNMTREPGAARNPVTMVILGLMMRVLIWAVMMLSILGNVGVNITALVASLGVGGIAIALAIQTVLSDVFASLAIGFDKPFVIGDFVVFNDIAGTIEHIGLKTTRIRKLFAPMRSCCSKPFTMTSGCRRAGLFSPLVWPIPPRPKNYAWWAIG